MSCKYLETKEQGREAFSTNLPVSFFLLSLGTTLRVQNSPISSTLSSRKWPFFDTESSIVEFGNLLRNYSRGIKRGREWRTGERGGDRSHLSQNPARSNYAEIAQHTAQEEGKRKRKTTSHNEGEWLYYQGGERDASFLPRDACCTHLSATCQGEKKSNERLRRYNYKLQQASHGGN